MLSNCKASVCLDVWLVSIAIFVFRYRESKIKIIISTSDFYSMGSSVTSECSNTAAMHLSYLSSIQIKIAQFYVNIAHSVCRARARNRKREREGEEEEEKEK